MSHIPAAEQQRTAQGMRDNQAWQQTPSHTQTTGNNFSGSHTGQYSGAQVTNTSIDQSTEGTSADRGNATGSFDGPQVTNRTVDQSTAGTSAGQTNAAGRFDGPQVTNTTVDQSHHGTSGTMGAGTGTTTRPSQTSQQSSGSDPLRGGIDKQAGYENQPSGYDVKEASFGDKVRGTAEELVGKLTGDQQKVAQGEALARGQH
ncbi:uncharacterized protein BYT42DRAFT_557835 [Radiomyces spectabilis]|uniref:uncharacterized protein n=1 Tax=Radiomyces spectabilis TaxID=64574 RepID=UPI00221F83B4|nr:uncharacterized protein BYT42DRAFT_557835 [Radiomyces spectabilis]KAI8391724.1 hypothetical protein BYT42DRAFT_557835 [Radiomyces spectabilis]